MGTQVITTDTGRRLGVVGEVMVDIDRREVVALGLRDNPLTRFLPGLPRWMPLEQIRQVGDVILVDSLDSLSESFNPDRYNRVINCQVVSESGEQLGRVLGFSFDIETGELVTVVVGAVGVPLLGEGILSTWELPVEEIVSSGPDRIIVYEGAEEKLKQLNSGLLEKLGIGGGSLEREERERYRLNMVPVENQLPAGQPSEQEQRRLTAAQEQRFQPQREEEMEYVEVEQRQRAREPQRLYLDDERDADPYSDRNAYREPEPFRGGERDRYGEPERYDSREPRYGEERRAMPRREGRYGEPLDVEAEPLDELESYRPRRERPAPNQSPVDEDPWA